MQGVALASHCQCAILFNGARNSAHLNDDCKYFGSTQILLRNHLFPIHFRKNLFIFSNVIFVMVFNFIITRGYRDIDLGNI